MSSRRRFLRLAGASLLLGAGGSALGCAAGAPGRRRWALAIDLQKCAREQGCRTCIDACHHEHNVPSIPEPRQEIKWVWKERYDRVLPVPEPEFAASTVAARNVLVLCNHCDNPPCVRVCPTQATWRRDDGVVAMDEHRCIGCRFCMAACPYGSRSFNWIDPKPFVRSKNPGYPTRTKGVVEKCNLCEERLARGAEPACVAACAAGALVFGDLRDPASPVRRLLDARTALRRRPELGTRPQVYYVG